MVYETFQAMQGARDPGAGCATDPEPDAGGVADPEAGGGVAEPEAGGGVADPEAGGGVADPEAGGGVGAVC